MNQLLEKSGIVVPGATPATTTGVVKTSPKKRQHKNKTKKKEKKVSPEFGDEDSIVESMVQKLRNYGCGGGASFIDVQQLKRRRPLLLLNPLWAIRRPWIIIITTRAATTTTRCRLTITSACRRRLLAVFSAASDGAHRHACRFLSVST